jgi:GTP cyclohydrolase IA
MTSSTYGYDELVFASPIPLPIDGVAHIGYLPSERLIAPPSLARAVARLAEDAGLLERLASRIAAWLLVELAPRGVGVVIELEQRPRGRIVTTALHGALRDDPQSRREFLDLTTRRTR